MFIHCLTEPPLHGQPMCFSMNLLKTLGSTDTFSTLSALWKRTSLCPGCCDLWHSCPLSCRVFIITHNSAGLLEWFSGLVRQIPERYTNLVLTRWLGTSERESSQEAPKAWTPLVWTLQILAKAFNATYRLELKPQQWFHTVVHVGLLKPYLICSTPQNNKHEGNTLDPLSHSPWTLELPGELVYQPELSQFHMAEWILEKGLPEIKLRIS